MTLYDLYLIKFAERFCIHNATNMKQFQKMFNQLVMGMDIYLIADTCQQIGES